MVLQPNAHGLFGYLKDTCHIRHQLLIRPSGAQLIETALDLRQRQQKDRSQQVRLHFQCVVALIAGTERRVFAGPAELFLMEQPVPQLMGAGKAQPPGRCFLFAERAVDEDGAALTGRRS